MSLCRPALVALLFLSTAAAPPRAARRTTSTTAVRPRILPGSRADLSLAHFRPTSTLRGDTIGVSGPLDADSSRLEVTISASADTGWRFQIRFRGPEGDTAPRRLSRARRQELKDILRREMLREPALAEPLAYLIADLGDRQPALSRPIDLDAFKIVSAAAVRGDGQSATLVRGFEGDRLLEIEMSFGEQPDVRVRRWRPDRNRIAVAHGRGRSLDPTETESLERILRRRARESRDPLDPSGAAAGLIAHQRQARAADH
jgi:hypothetical protein